MTDAPQLSQSTSIAKATATDDRLSALVPSLATEYSPVKVYLPGAAQELPSDQQDGRQLPDGTERYVWVAPDVNGDGSDYTVEVECIGAGGGGGGGTTEIGSAAIGLGSWAGSAGTTATITTSGSDTVSGDTLVLVAMAGNSTSQTTSVTDSAGNIYTLAASGIISGTPAMQAWVYICYNALSLVSGSTVKFTTSNSEVVNAYFVRCPSVVGPSSAQPVITLQTTAAASLTLNGNWDAGDGVMALAFHNTSGITWNASLTNPNTAYWAPFGPANQANGSETMSMFFGNPPAAWASSSDNLVLGASASVATALGIVIPFKYAHVPVDGATGGGGGGGEYAAEVSYPVTPGYAYTYQIGNQGNSGFGSLAATDGGDTIFDLHGFGESGGVVAHGGGGGSWGGNPGAGGTGSTNSVHYDGGSGGASSSGLGSDNPVMYSTAVASDEHYFRLTLDETLNNYAAYDIGQNHRSVTRHLLNGGVIRPTGPTDTFVSTTASPSAPAQVPPSGRSTSTAGNSWRWVLNGNGQNGGLEVTGIPKHRITAFTMSAWIRGGSEATGPNDWGGTSAIIMGCHNLAGSSNGFLMYMNNGTLVSYAGDGGSGAVAWTSNTKISATDGKWHLVQVDYTQNTSSTGTIRVWIDGVVDGSYTGSMASGTVVGGDFNMTIGENLANSWNPFAGQISNAWFTANYFLTPTIAGQIFGTSPSSGGGGGGASGGSAGTGAAGSNSSGTAGGAGGAANSTLAPPGILDSNAGNAGGARGSAGATGGSFGGGGGGAGRALNGYNNNGTMYNLTAPANRSATYTGMDATASGGSLYSNSDDQWSEGDSIPDQTISTSLCIAGGKPELPANGTMASIIQFPIIGSLPTWDGTTLGASGGTGRRWSISAAYLTLTINTANAALIGLSFVFGEVMPDELTDVEVAEWATSTAGISPALYYIPAGDAGRQVTLTLNVPSYTSYLQSSQSPLLIAVSTFRGSTTVSPLTDEVVDMLIGGYSDPENEEFYCEFYGAGTDGGIQDAELSFDYAFNGAGSAQPLYGSPGNAGQIRVSYLTDEGTPVTTILPAAATDAGGNTLGVGVTTDGLQTWQPGTSPKVVETWHSVGDATTGLGSTWSNSWGTTGSQVARFKRLPGNRVWLVFEAQNSSTVSGTSTVMTLPVNYRPAAQSSCPVRVFSSSSASAANSVVNMGIVIGTDGTVQIRNAPASTNYCSANVIIPLD